MSAAAPDGPGLLTRTTPAWAALALADPVALLGDHAHLEKKAAVNALDLLHRWPDARGLRRRPAEEEALVAEWTRALAAVARDEVEHLGLVLRELRARGGTLPRVHRNGYAAGLRRLVRAGGGPAELVDRLLVSALIEARSCERFGALAAAEGAGDLRGLYRGLLASERGHHRLFLDLARRVQGGGDVESRWRTLCREEARVLGAEPPGPAMHSGEPAAPPARPS